MNILDNEGLEYYNERLIAYLKSLSAPAAAGVSSFNGRGGDVTPQSGDYTASDVGALPSTGGTLSGNLTIKGSGNYGTKINFGDGDYVHISEPEDDCMEIKAKKVNFVLSESGDTKFTVNGSNPFGSSITLPLSISNGGTGATTASSAMYNLTSPLTTRSSDAIGNYLAATYIPCTYGSVGYKFNVESLINAISSHGPGANKITATGTGESTVSVIMPYAIKSNNLLFGFSSQSSIGDFYVLFALMNSNRGAMIFPRIGTGANLDVSYSGSIVTITGSNTLLSGFNYSGATISYLLF